MTVATITRIAAEVMPWGSQVRGDADRCWLHRKGNRRGELLGVLKRPIGFANESAIDEQVTIQTDGHIIAVVDQQPISVRLAGGRIAAKGAR